MYVAEVPNRNSRPASLLRESYREGGKVKNRTLANLSSLPIAQITLIKEVLRGEPLVAAQKALSILRSLPHGHVACVLGMLRRLEVDRLIHRRGSRQRTLVVAMIVARILRPGSKLATARALASASAHQHVGNAVGHRGDR